jgi:hypothetical protein
MLVTHLNIQINKAILFNKTVHDKKYYMAIIANESKFFGS